MIMLYIYIYIYMLYMCNASILEIVEFEGVNLVMQAHSSFTDTAVASWVSSCRVCDTVIQRYQLKSGMGGIISVYSPSISVTLQGLACAWCPLH